MRYRISYNMPSKVILGLLGMGHGRVEVRPDEVYGRMGWGGNVTIPRDRIASVERLARAPLWTGFGVHGMFGAWSFNGSLAGAVKITMRKPARGTVMFIPVRPRAVFFSLEKPDEFVHDVMTGRA